MTITGLREGPIAARGNVASAGYKDVDEVVATCQRAGLGRRVARLPADRGRQGMNRSG